MQFSRNHWLPRFSASRLTAVGERRVSIGPPISVMVVGTRASPSASIRATAAISGTAGWHTPSVWRGASSVFSAWQIPMRVAM